jgi:hypothetical protein
MPAKSRRNRRNISQGPKTTINRSVASPEGVTPVAAARPERTVNTNNTFSTSARVAASPVLTDTHVLSEIKWISLVTVIVAVILVILYVFLH